MTAQSVNPDLAPNAPQHPHWVHAITGLFEVALLMGASLAMAILVQQNLSPGLMETLGVGTQAEPDFIAASGILVLQFGAQYGVLLMLAGLVGWLRHRRRLQDYAISAPQGHKRPIVYGIATGLVIGILPGIVMILQEIAPIGANTPFWEVQQNAQWDWRFWLFMGVGSFALIPLIEEGAWRGYVQGRLLEGFAPGAAILMTTLMFALLHIQYLQADLALQLTFVGLLISSLAFGVITYRTGSLVPAIIAHAMINTPMSLPFKAAIVGLGILVLLVGYKSIWRELCYWGGVFLRWSTLAALPGLALIAVIGLLAARIPNGVPLIASGLVTAVAVFGFLKPSAYR